MGEGRDGGYSFPSTALLTFFNTPSSSHLTNSSNNRSTDITIIKSKIVRIGNSQGVRIPHFLLQQLHLANEVEMSIQDDQLVIRAARKPRQDWEARFARTLPADEISFEEELPQLSDWDGTEWTW